MTFYKEALNGEFAHEFSRFGTESGMPLPVERQNWIMHSEVKAGNIHIMAADNPMGETVFGNNVSLSLGFDDVSEMEAIFTNLSKGGEIVMELQDTFWGARFGMLTDRFGNHWMVNCYLKK